MGTIVNAAYGIANQINGLLVYFSATLQKSFNPQLMKSEGMNDNDRMLRFSFSLSRMSVLAIIVLALPLIVEMPYILSLWLGDNIPDNTIEFTRYILVLSIVYQFSAGVMSAIQSRGRIRNYTLTMSIILLANLPLTYLILRLEQPVYYVLVSMIIIEVICLIVRLCFAHSLCGLSITDFIKQIIVPTALVSGLVYGLLTGISHLLASSIWRVLVICIADIVLFVPFAYYFILSDDERQRIAKLLTSLIPHSRK